MKKRLEYIWLDGTSPTQQIRSKIKIHSFPDDSEKINPTSLPKWNFDGSSCEQGTTEDSDRILIPVAMSYSPFPSSDFIVLCEVFKDSSTPHETNTRSKVCDLYRSLKDYVPMVGFEQEYIIREKEGNIAGWPNLGFPSPQGQYYCAVGTGNVSERKLPEMHMTACLNAGLAYCGMNAEVRVDQIRTSPLSVGFL